MKVFVTGDGVCPWCGREVIGDDVTTHHTHTIKKGEKTVLRKLP